MCVCRWSTESNLKQNINSNKTPPGSMDQLFVEIEVSENGAVYTSVHSFVALYVYRYLNSPAHIGLNFVQRALPVGSGKLKLQLARKDTATSIPYKEAIDDLRLPVYAKQDNTYIAGMCAVCRALLMVQHDAAQRQLLGFKEGCLLAPAECSTWTRYCEVNVPQAISDLLCALQACKKLDEMPQALSAFEQHMKEPVRMHNIYKLARDLANKQQQAEKKRGKVMIDCSTPKEQLQLKHRFAEGTSCTLADLVLYPLFKMVFQICTEMLPLYPLTQTWLSELEAHNPKFNAILLELHVPTTTHIVGKLKVARTEATSLYKNDPKRYNARKRIYTEQNEVNATLARLEALNLDFTSDNVTVYDDHHIDWHAIDPEHEKSSALPIERLARKRQQLENLANAVVSLATPGERIIDFCSGTGHLGILLALQLPQCTVILMENKAISLERAKERAAALKLSNIRYYQCNIDYFVGEFDIGTALHACGTATDIVLQQCRRSKAKFVCCPCCYGSLQPMPHIAYPLSNCFRAVLDEKDFLYIAHTADQAHALGTLNCKPETSRQGQLCMDIVDTDRKLQAEEEGYDVILTRLKPEECTPKNRLLVGQPKSKLHTHT